MPHRELPSCDKGDFRGQGQKSKRHHGHLKRILREAAGTRPSTRLQKYCLNHREYTTHTLLSTFPAENFPSASKNRETPPLSCRSRSQNTAAIMASDFEKLKKTEFFKWKKEDESWASFLAEIRTAILMTQRQTKSRAATTRSCSSSKTRGLTYKRHSISLRIRSQSRA